MTARDEVAARIAALNDAFRKGERPELGRIVITRGARAAVAAWPLGEIALYAKVKAFSEFTEDNDPHDEHDFGAFEHAGERFFWQIAYYEADGTFNFGAENPEDAETTTRVLTIMLAADY